MPEEKLTACGECVWRWRVRPKKRFRKYDYCRKAETREKTRFDCIKGAWIYMIMLCSCVNTEGNCKDFSAKEADNA